MRLEQIVSPPVVTLLKANHKCLYSQEEYDHICRHAITAELLQRNTIFILLAKGLHYIFHKYHLKRLKTQKLLRAGITYNNRVFVHVKKCPDIEAILLVRVIIL